MYRKMVDFMKNAAKFLYHPILQYIPLTVRTLGSSENWGNPYNQRQQHFFLFQDPKALQSALTRYQINARIPDTGGELYVITFNYQAEAGLFRYLTCKIIGKSVPGSYHVFSFTKKYFPRRMLHFVLYENDGTRLRWLNEEIY